MNPTLVLCVPGLWAKSSDPIVACAPQGYIWAGPKSVVLDPATSRRRPFEVEASDPDPSMREAFEICSGGRLPPDVLARIGAHTLTLYAVTSEPPSAGLCLELMRFAGALLEAGGLAVMVETCGVAHSAERWREFLSMKPAEIAAYHALTIRVADPEGGRSYTCGLRHFGLPDARIEGATAEATKILDVLGKYMVFERPEIRDGQTFSVSQDAPVYRLRREKDLLFPPEHLYHNPHGAWRLEGPISSDTRRP